MSERFGRDWWPEGVAFPALRLAAGLPALLLANAILLLAAWHKLKLTPKLLTHSNAAIDMRRSIQIEMLIGLCIFLITAVLTTVLGPQS